MLTVVLHMLATFVSDVPLLTMLSTYFSLTCLTLRCCTVWTEPVKLPTSFVPCLSEVRARMLRSLCECGRRLPLSLS